MMSKTLIVLCVFAVAAMSVSAERIQVTSDDQMTLAPNTEVTGDTICSGCKLFAAALKNMLMSNSTDDTIFNFLYQMCSDLPSPTQQNLCQAMLDANKDIILHAMENLDPSYLCELIGLCSSDNLEANLAKLRAIMEAKDAAAKEVAVVGDGQFCNLCELALGYAEGLLQNNASIAEVEKLLGDVCHFLPKSYEDMCNSFVSQELPQVIQYLLEKESPSVICSQVGLCKSQTLKAAELISLASSASSSVADKKIVIPEALLIEFAHEMRVGGNATCGPCKLVTQLIQVVSKAIGSDSFIAACEGVCSIMPGSFSEQCDELVAVVVNVILSYPPEEVCQFIDLC